MKNMGKDRAHVSTTKSHRPPVYFEMFHRERELDRSYRAVQHMAVDPWTTQFYVQVRYKKKKAHYFPDL